MSIRHRIMTRLSASAQVLWRSVIAPGAAIRRYNLRPPAVYTISAAESTVLAAQSG